MQNYIFLALIILVLMISISSAEAVSHLMYGEPVSQDTSSDNAVWLASLNKSMAIILPDITVLDNISNQDKGVRTTELQMIWSDLDNQQTYLKNHPAPNDLALAYNDYSSALSMLRSSVIGLESLGTPPTKVISLGNNPTSKGDQIDYSKLGESNLKSCKMYLARIPNDINMSK